MLRAALGTAFLSAVKNLIGIANLSRCASLPPEIYRMLGAVCLYFKSSVNLLYSSLPLRLIAIIVPSGLIK